MTSRAGTRAALGTALAVAVVLGSCGFSDELTSRGFIEEGDQICIDTLVKTGAGLNSRGGVPPADFLGALAGAYRDAGGRFERLQVRTDDEEMRDSTAEAYSSFSHRLQAAARGVGPQTDSDRIFSDISAQQSEMKAYGFEVCGGGGA